MQIITILLGNLLVQNHINAILTMETIAAESAIKLRNLSDSLSKHLSTLKQLGEPTERDTLIIYVCTSNFFFLGGGIVFKNFLKERARKYGNEFLENPK